ncbi:MAG: DnaD domain protein [Epulopiscium sp.]|nr:DnaD domain protein [Candidatus Epulonipiscium sp.]
MLLQFSYPQYPSSIPLSLIFIKEYMPKANGTFVKVYLYGLSYCYQKNDDLSLQTIGNTLDILESDVMKAFEYWQKLGLVQIQENTKGKFQIEYKIPIAPIPEQSKINETLVSKTKPISIQSKPQYGPKELSIYRKTPEIDQLFKIAERYLGRMLTQQDLSTLYSFYDWLRLPIEVIEILLEHCISNGHRNMRYIEKVAINWAEDGVFTIDQAKARAYIFNTEYRKIMKAFGLSQRDPAPVEVNYMKKWLTEYDLPLPIILEACKRTIENTGKPTFAYADSIITHWHQNKVKQWEDIKKLDETYFQKKNTSKPSRSQRPSRFVNFEQKSWDFEKLERLEQEYIDKQLSEGR